MPKFTIVCALALAGFSGGVWAAPSKGLPPNTIDCKDFTPLPRGYWYAHPDAKTFNVGESKNMGVQGWTFGPHKILVGSGHYDLSDILDRKCGHSTGKGI